ncbi:uncharacterized protein DSM5745_05448 [Aspergillus mulundensis]|uniref:FAD-binding domain-containing protein n=1 Tax=Aspergillus mulundensis TaxID=1810919 RepID=A0A3D8RX76_9EURO|nr:Uncharacterized protein DSM5745_05448 [Aspergillus mulundensis]RDW78596.1 Uncharacterized protein DSM5745_05448 [Aspergillus mulundensis]
MTTQIPHRCTVLVIGGGPGGSYTASVLAREGIDTVLLEAESFPRYHIGESMLPSFRHYLRFIDADKAFDQHGFTKKVGAAFKLTPENSEGWSDFLAFGGPTGHTWNVIRSEADEMLFRHAGKSGARTFDGVKVTDIQFKSGPSRSPTPSTTSASSTTTNDAEIGRPISASYLRKDNNLAGTISFDYLVDATGRAGLLGTKYLKNRRYNKTLKNVANWAYYRNIGKYGKNTRRENSPIFEALHVKGANIEADESGWAWLIPLHNGTTSVGVVRSQAIATEKKSAAASLEAYFEDALTLAPMLSGILHQNSASEMVTTIKSASDYSYHSTRYSLPYARIVGDAGCFIDPFFSSGVHLALTGGLAAATTIAASIRGDVSEETAAKWHSAKVSEGYSWFLLAVLAAYRQMRNQGVDVLNGLGEANFDRAFDLFRPIIQGSVETPGGITKTEFSRTIDFFLKTLDEQFERNEEISDDDEPLGWGDPINKSRERSGGVEDESDTEILKALRKSYGNNLLSIGGFTTDVVEGRVPRLERGRLTLVLAEEKK